MKGRILFFTLSLVGVLVVLSAGAASGSIPALPAQPAPEPDRLPGQTARLSTNQIMVKFKAAANDAVQGTGVDAASLASLSRTAGEELTYVRPMSGGAHVLAVNEARPAAEMAGISARLAALPEVEYAEPDLIKTIDRRPLATANTANLTPDDTRYGEQWHYTYIPGTAEGLNLPPAWSITTGMTNTVVAVIDTGILADHPDLVGRIVPGYDMISNAFVANDGDGRDPDPSDPGDWVAADDPCSPTSNSSWHGTHVAGTIGAASNNGQGVAGVNWHAKILPVRALGKCGGWTSDIIDAVRWAAGLSVPFAPANANPADVINLSLGGSGSCSTGEQDAFDDAAAAGATVIIAAGNNSGDAANYSPGNCDGIITVAATNRTGYKAYYSNYGSVVEVSAPGGETFTKANGILSTLNDGATNPGDYIYDFYQGTSMAAPHVAGLASLIKGLKPSFGQQQILAILQNTARSFPASSNCTTSNCGAGIVDAYRAILAVSPQNLANHLYLPVVFTPINAPLVSFASSNFSTNEEDGQAMLLVKLSEAGGQQVRVAYRTIDGSAKAGSDYVQKDATLTFNPGETSKTIAIDLIDDSTPEGAKTFYVELHSPSAAVIGSPDRATVTIWDGDDVTFVPNGDFEQGPTIWSEYSYEGWPLIMTELEGLPVTPRSGQYAVWLGGGNDELAYIEQSLQIPVAAPYLIYWHWIESVDSCANDLAGVFVNGTDVVDAYELCATKNTGGWVKHSTDLSDWAGQTVTLEIVINTNSTYYSSLYIDDVAFAASPVPPSMAASSASGLALPLHGHR